MKLDDAVTTVYNLKTEVNSFVASSSIGLRRGKKWQRETVKHQENMSIKYIPPHTPILYRKIGVCRGIPIFLIFAPKHRLWVLVRTATIYILSKNKKNVKKNSAEHFQILKLKSLCLWHGHVYVMNSTFRPLCPML